MAKSGKSLAGVARGGSGAFSSSTGIEAKASTTKPASLASVARGSAKSDGTAAEARSGDVGQPSDSGSQMVPMKMQSMPKANKDAGEHGSKPPITPSL